MERRLQAFLHQSKPPSSAASAVEEALALRKKLLNLEDLSKRKDSGSIPLAKGIEATLVQLRERLREEMARASEEEADLETELEVLRQADAFEEPPRPINAPKSLENLERNDPVSRIQELDGLIEKNGGQTCGWFKEDHDDFVRILAKHKRDLDSKDFQTAIGRAFPLFSLERLNEHIAAYRKYLGLEEAKKGLVAKHKEEKKNVLLSRAAQIETVERSRETQQRLEQEKNFAQHQAKVKSQVESWRVQKALSAELSKNRQKQLEEENERQRLQQELKQRLEKERNLALLSEYKARRKRDQELLEEQRRKKEEESKPAVDPLTANRIRMKEEEALRRKNELVKERVARSEHRKTILEAAYSKVSDKYLFVEPKLAEQTKAAVGKIVKKFDPKKQEGKWGDNFAGVLVRTQGRKLPEWRSRT